MLDYQGFAIDKILPSFSVANYEQSQDSDVDARLLNFDTLIDSILAKQLV
jgi:hypothetical protein